MTNSVEQSHRGPDDWPALIVASYQREVGAGLCRSAELMDHSDVVLCHDTAFDPVFVFANVTAQRLWGRTATEFLGLPSRLSAAPAEQADRSAALATDSVVRGYSGVRVRADGSSFQIFDAAVWPVFVYARDGSRQRRVGQAATFGRWEDL